MMASIAHTLKEQGADGVPPPVDKRSWELCGPLGALQRCMAAASRQLEKLHEHRGSLRNETDALSERLANELLTQRQLEKDLHAARSSEAETMRLKEQVSAQQDGRCGVKCGEVWGLNLCHGHYFHPLLLLLYADCDAARRERAGPANFRARGQEGVRAGI